MIGQKSSRLLLESVNHPHVRDNEVIALRASDGASRLQSPLLLLPGDTSNKNRLCLFGETLLVSPVSQNLSRRSR